MIHKYTEEVDKFEALVATRLKNTSLTASCVKISAVGQSLPPSSVYDMTCHKQFVTKLIVLE
jgi:hypothetical protein